MKELTFILILLISNLTTAQIERKTDTLEVWTFSIGNFINLQNYTELNKIDDNKYEFIIYSFDLKNVDEKQVFEMNFISDLKNKQVKIID